MPSPLSSFLIHFCCYISLCNSWLNKLLILQRKWVRKFASFSFQNCISFYNLIMESNKFWEMTENELQREMRKETYHQRLTDVRLLPFYPSWVCRMSSPVQKYHFHFTSWLGNCWVGRKLWGGIHNFPCHSFSAQRCIRIRWHLI